MKNEIERHHLLEIILWPKEDGSFITIHNSFKRLDELGIYKQYKLTIPLERKVHAKLHYDNLSDERRKQMSLSNSGRFGELNSFFGKHHTEETKQKLSELHKGVPSWNAGLKMSKEFCEKVKANHARCDGIYNANYGKRWTDEQRKAASERKTGLKHSYESKLKMSEARKGVKHSDEHRKHLAESNAKRSALYKEYKAQNGNLKFNEWCKTIYRTLKS